LHSFFLLKFDFVIFWSKNIGAKAAHSHCRTNLKKRHGTHVMHPLHLVGSRVGLDGAVQVDVVALGDAERVDVLAQAQLNFWRICKNITFL